MEMRFATEEDAPALLEIYGQYIDTPITFETELPSLEDFRWRIREFSRDYPYLVSVQDGRRTEGSRAMPMRTRPSPAMHTASMPRPRYICHVRPSIRAPGLCFTRSYWTISDA